MSPRTKKMLAGLALASLVAIPVAAAAINAPEGFAYADTHAMAFMTGPRSHEGAMGGQMGMMTGPRSHQGAMGGHEGAMGSQMGTMDGQMGMFGQMEFVESEFDFLARMIPHHEEAIASAEVLLQGTDRPEMEAFAQEIIDTQTAEVAKMQEWLAAWYPGQDISVDYEAMMRDLDGLTGDELDQAFLEDMTVHHMAAVMMSQQLVMGDLAEHPEVIPFAEQIRDNQHTEIFQMRGWIVEWFGESPMGPMNFSH